MMHYFDIKRYPRERGKNCVHYFGGDYSGNTVNLVLQDEYQ